MSGSFLYNSEARRGHFSAFIQDSQVRDIPALSKARLFFFFFWWSISFSPWNSVGLFSHAAPLQLLYDDGENGFVTASPTGNFRVRTIGNMLKEKKKPLDSK